MLLRMTSPYKRWTNYGQHVAGLIQQQVHLGSVTQRFATWHLKWYWFLLSDIFCFGATIRILHFICHTEMKLGNFRESFWSVQGNKFWDLSDVFLGLHCINNDSFTFHNLWTDFLTVVSLYTAKEFLKDLCRCIVFIHMCYMFSSKRRL